MRFKFPRPGIRKRLRIFGLLIPLLFFTTVRPTDGDIFCYADVAGSTVEFVDIMEMSDEDVPLYGEPSVNLDSLLFPGFGFSTSAIGAGAADLEFKQGLLELTIRADPGRKINSIEIEEFGSYFLFGATPSVFVSTSGFATADGDTFDGNAQFTDTGTGSGNWMHSFTLNFPETEEVRLVLDSQILAFANNSEVAFVDKLGININVSTVSVPEPSGLLALTSTVLLGLVLARRRKLVARFS